MTIRVVKLVIQFKDLLLAKVALQESRWIDLRRIFKLIDTDHSDNISESEVLAFNILLDPLANVQQLREDCALLFQLADHNKDGFISETEWLKGWVNHYKMTETYAQIDAFLASFHRVERERGIRPDNLRQANRFTWSTLRCVLKWKHRAIESVRQALGHVGQELESTE